MRSPEFPPVSATAQWLSPLEEAWAIPLGSQPGVAPLQPDGSVTARRAFESEVLRALAKSPCVVSFSGGRDSSTVLAFAAHLAKREGLDPPIAATHVFPQVADSNETTWQQQVIRQLGVDDWVRMSWTDELDNIGPYAQRTLRQHGLASPSNSHFLLPMFDLARGGSLLTGVGGDEIFELVDRTVAARILYRGHRPRLREVRGFVANVAPRPLRRRKLRRDLPLRYPWLTDRAADDLVRSAADWMSRVPIRFDAAVREWWWPSRLLQVAQSYGRAVAVEAGAELVQPFTSATFLAALAAEAGPAGPGGRGQGLRKLAGDLLEPAILSRTSKAGFGEAFNGHPTRAFARNWDGGGLDTQLINVDGLRSEWLSPDPEPHSLVLLQRAWLESVSRAESSSS